MAAKHHGPYERYVKRPLDLLLSSCAAVVLSPVIGVTAILVRTKIGSPVLFFQERPGRIDPKTGKERVFRMYKFRSMTNERGADGELLPDEERMTAFGKALRSTSLDELPELFNIIKGDMSLIGPRPQLVRDMVFMTKEERRRHTVRPGLSGLAQVRGRNSLSWEGRLAADLEYVDNITFAGDLKIIVETFMKVFKREGISEEGISTSTDYGDYLLASGKVSKEEYDRLQAEAKKILAEKEDRK